MNKHLQENYRLCYDLPKGLLQKALYFILSTTNDNLVTYFSPPDIVNRKLLYKESVDSGFQEPIGEYFFPFL